MVLRTESIDRGIPNFALCLALLTNTLIRMVEKSSKFLLIFLCVVLRLKLLVQRDRILRNIATLSEIHHPLFKLREGHALKLRLLCGFLNKKILGFPNLHAPDCRPHRPPEQHKNPAARREAKSDGIRQEYSSFSS